MDICPGCSVPDFAACMRRLPNAVGRIQSTVWTLSAECTQLYVHAQARIPARMLARARARAMRARQIRVRDISPVGYHHELAHWSLLSLLFIDFWFDTEDPVGPVDS